MESAETPRPAATAGSEAGGDVSCFVVDLARRVGGTLDLPTLLDRTAEAVVELLAFEVAVLHLVTAEGNLEAVAVAGPPATRTELPGTRTPARAWRAAGGGPTPGPAPVRRRRRGLPRRGPVLGA